MLDLSPTKLIIIFVVMIVLLGPKRLPQVARQLGATWRKAVNFQQQLERELRQSLPDLPSTRDVARFTRGPLTMLSELADMSAASVDKGAVEPRLPPPDGSSAADTGAPSASRPPRASRSVPVLAEALSSTSRPQSPRRADPTALGGFAALATDDPALN